MDYYTDTQYLVRVDKQDKITGQVEKWEAHRNGILHRGYTAVLKMNDQVILQQRKHPVFDNVLDLSFSSHQLYKDGSQEDNLTAVMRGLNREWFITEKELKIVPVFLRKVYYFARDTATGYIEHEIDYVYLVELHKVPSFSPDVAYGFKTAPIASLINNQNSFSPPFAPWVLEILKEGLF